ncbi:MAG: hypothetical protein WAL51_14155, partial [Candidatus Acidiferrales bacterium]
SSGSTSATALNSYSTTDGTSPVNFPVNVIPDGNGGVLAAYAKNYNAPPLTIVDVGPNGTTSADFSSLQIAVPFNNLVLGDSNTAFVTDESTVLAIQVPSLSVSWSYPSSGGLLSLVAGTRGGGVLVNDSEQGLVQLDSFGNSGTPIAALQYPLPWSLGVYYDISSSEMTSISGPNTPVSGSDFPEPQGSGAQNQQPNEPSVTYFTPVPAVFLGTTPTQLYNGTLEYVGTGRAHIKYLAASANPQTFKSEVAQPITFAGFIGHSFDIGLQPPFGTGDTSVGLRFTLSNTSLIRTPQPGDPFIYSTTDTEGTKVSEVPHIDTQASVIFVGSCYSGPLFQDFWNIGSTGTQALIVLKNPSATVLLGHAAAAWQQLLYDMIVGNMTVQDAVHQINAYLPTITDINGIPVSERYKFVGNGCVTAKGVSPNCVSRP